MPVMPSSTFDWLSELFPQVDLRVLKAVSIEHADDVDCAIEFIINDILPKIDEYNMPPHHEEPKKQEPIICGSGSVVHNESSSKEKSVAVESLQTEEEFRQITGYSQGTAAADSLKPEPILLSNSLHQSVANFKENRGSSSSGQNSYGHDNEEFTCHIYWDEHSEGLPTEVPLSRDAEEDLWNACSHVRSVPTELSSLDLASLKSAAENDAKKQSIPPNTSLNDDSFLSHPQGFNFFIDSSANAKSNEGDMLSSLEELTKMMNEVSLLERKAKDAKYEAYTAGQDVFAKIHLLKVQLTRARDEKSKYSGDVNGERSILATEARELHNRINSLSRERANYSGIIEEIRQALTERIAAAEREVEQAHKEKTAKEAQAHATWNEHKTLLDDLMNELANWQQQATDNQKLREFLIQRGEMVDSLQGEMAVIFEDVMRLKEAVDKRQPLTKLQRSLMSSLSSSSFSSSQKSAANSCHLNPHWVMPGRDGPVLQTSSPAENLRGLDGSGSAGDADVLPKGIADDDWEIFSVA